MRRLNIVGASFCWLLLLIGTASCSKKGGPGPEPPPVDTTVNPTQSLYLKRALETNEFSASQLRTSFYSYRVNISNSANTAYEWYNTSQIYADAAMLEIGDESFRKQMEQTTDFMANMWDDSDPNGGYFAFSNLDGSGSSGTKYVDDNSLTGVIYLEAAESSSGVRKQQYVDKAIACANWIIKSGVWDDQLGGGFWWNTEKIYKPTQTNGLVLQLMLRLYDLTGDSLYRDWAVKVNNWLQTKMWDSNSGLYIWQYDKDGTKYGAFFTYDNAIMLEAFLLYNKVMQEPAYLSRAQDLARAMNQTLWDGNYNVYVFNTEDRRITPAWCGWASQSLIRLYEVDKNSSWLSYAKGNIDAINAVLRNPDNKAYYQFAGLNGAGRYSNFEGVDQAWMQRIQALLSKYY